MHKNQRSASAEKIQKTIFEQNLSSITFDDPITKTYFFHKLAQLVEIPVIYVDFDLLYSGYLAANILPQNENLEIITPKEDWQDDFAQILDKISVKRHLVIIDSLNGFFGSMMENKESGRIINSVLVLLASVAQKQDSIIVFGSTAKLKEDGWVLPGIGRKVVQIQKMNFLAIQKRNETLNLVSLNPDNSVKYSISLSDLDLV
ncbi:MAG: hypothetical protein EB150_01910 [Nitrososphaeria archaeon]|nr:hypothetical protein [Nitrososphaeria archaeon]NDB52070.1 hypothetical protein [Nitrosopumilaceae archaeon]NDB90041.1 hypothetical protein [Nitrososphaerota archaeon]NDB46921.1 hypothetical protein [Nitrososphaeria archaeon]NDB62990.1 hypothetical protein [Nitrosopumilaceae archaeon]